jgi:hypothetical protein
MSDALLHELAPDANGVDVLSVGVDLAVLSPRHATQVRYRAYRIRDASKATNLIATTFAVAYLGLVDIILGPLPSPLRRLTQPVTSLPHRFSTSRLPRLACLCTPCAPAYPRSFTHILL